MKTSQKNKLDTLFSRIIREEGKCEICGETKYLNCHHYIGRRNQATRWFIPNGVCLCPKCHTFGIWSAHQNPEWFRGEMIKLRGNIWLKELKTQSNKISKPNYNEILKYLNENN